MASAEAPPPPSEAPVLPDYMTNQNAVLGDLEATWRFGKPPDYTNTRKVFAQTKQQSHAPGSLEDLVQNLVKNWEIEASFKTAVDDWRTVDPETYTFAINGGPAQSAESMVRIGTYNAVIAPNEYYSPRHSDFASSHKTFKRMMPTFAWEVLEVYSGPPVVAFRWRHWGTMKEDYVGWNHDGEKITAKAHGGQIDIQGVTVAHLNPKFQITKLETWFDPVEMFRQVAPEGVVKKELMAAAAAAGCPVAHHAEPAGDSKALLSDAQALDAAREADKAVADGQAKLGANTTASEANPVHGEIPKANAE
ncbi:hypothetical protein LQW54_012536 [Pestalotiopsis sp. IQ-011]